MKWLNTLFFTFLLSLIAACGGGGDGGSSPAGQNQTAALGMLGDSSHVALHGVSTMRLAGTYTAQGQSNIVGLIPSACSDPKPSMWMSPCPQGQVILTKITTGWLEEHILPAHVAGHNTRFEYSDGNGISVDHEGCTYSQGGVRTTLARHPTSSAPLQFERTCPGQGAKSYTVSIQESVVGDSNAGNRTSVYTFMEGGMKVMTLSFLSGVEMGRLVTTGVTYAYFDAYGGYTKLLQYWTVTQ